MYIPRPAKCCSSMMIAGAAISTNTTPPLSDWTKLAVERIFAYGTCLMGVRRYCCASADCTHARFFCRSCKFKACGSCGFKTTEQ